MLHFYCMVTAKQEIYTWPAVPKVAGYPGRFAQEALEHNGKTVHRAYAKRRLMKMQSL